VTTAEAPPPIADGDSEIGTETVLLAPPAPPTRLSWWKVGAVGAVGLAGCAYVAFYDPTSTSLYPPCPFKTMTGLDCPGCGITRALHALTNGDVVRALDHNVLFVLALPVLLWWMVRGVLTSTGGWQSKPRFRWRNWMTWALVGILGAFWVLRNLPYGPFEWLAAVAS
jgi:hypothetical protein